jgi:hypothetical protein
MFVGVVKDRRALVRQSMAHNGYKVQTCFGAVRKQICDRCDWHLDPRPRGIDGVLGSSIGE